MMTTEGRDRMTASARKSGFLGGMLINLRAIPFLFAHPRLMAYAVVPLIINVVLFVVFFYISLTYFHGWISRFLPQGEAWYAVFLIYLLSAVLVVLLLLIVVLTFTVAANILASPFNDALSARTQELMTGLKPRAGFSVKAILAETSRTVIEEIKKLVFYLVVMGVLLLLNLIPVAGQVLNAILGGLFTVFWVGLSFVDYALAREGFRLGGKLRFGRRHFPPVFGYGLGVFIGLLVPVLNLVLIPVAVVAGTMLYVELEKTAGGLPAAEPPSTVVEPE